MVTANKLFQRSINHEVLASQRYARTCDSMSRITLVGVLASAVGCTAALDAPTQAADRYVLVPTPPGCYQHVASGDRNIELSAELESQMLALLAYEDPEVSRCWYERLDGSLLLALGDECGSHRTADFLLVKDAWILEAEENVPIALCDERRW